MTAERLKDGTNRDEPRGTGQAGLVEASPGRKDDATGSSGTDIGVTERWVRKLLRRMKKQGDSVVVHGLRGRASNRKLPAKTQKQALVILRHPDWHDFGPTFAAE